MQWAEFSQALPRPPGSTPGETPPVAYGDRFPFLSPAVTSSPGAGEVVLWDGAFGITVNFPAKVQSFRFRQRLPLRGSWQSRQALTEGVSSREKGVPKSPQAFQNPKILNNSSAETAQSNAEGILNRPPPLPRSGTSLRRHIIAQAHHFAHRANIIASAHHCRTAAYYRPRPPPPPWLEPPPMPPKPPPPKLPPPKLPPPKPPRPAPPPKEPPPMPPKPPPRGGRGPREPP